MLRKTPPLAPEPIKERIAIDAKTKTAQLVETKPIAPKPMEKNAPTTPTEDKTYSMHHGHFWGDYLPPELINKIAAYLEDIHKKSIATNIPDDPEEFSIFQRLCAPSITIGKFYQRIIEYIPMSSSSSIVSLCLFHYISQIVPITPLTIHQLLLVSFRIGNKFLDDDCYENTLFSKVGEIPLKMFNEMEQEFLILTNYKNIDLEEYKRMLRLLLANELMDFDMSLFSKPLLRYYLNPSICTMVSDYLKPNNLTGYISQCRIFLPRFSDSSKTVFFKPKKRPAIPIGTKPTLFSATENIASLIKT